AIAIITTRNLKTQRAPTSHLKGYLNDPLELSRCFDLRGVRVWNCFSEFWARNVLADCQQIGLLR
ncbi:MAG: hypothetical protein ACKO9Q_26470, partial [Pirellula sp.]